MWISAIFQPAPLGLPHRVVARLYGLFAFVHDSLSECDKSHVAMIIPFFRVMRPMAMGKVNPVS